MLRIHRSAESNGEGSEKRRGAATAEKGMGHKDSPELDSILYTFCGANSPWPALAQACREFLPNHRQSASQGRSYKTCETSARGGFSSPSFHLQSKRTVIPLWRPSSRLCGRSFGCSFLCCSSLRS